MRIMELPGGIVGHNGVYGNPVRVEIMTWRSINSGIPHSFSMLDFSLYGYVGDSHLNGITIHTIMTNKSFLGF